MTMDSPEVVEKCTKLLTCIKPLHLDSNLPELLNLCQLRRLCAEGVPDELPGLRAVVWKALLGYLPANVLRWGECLAKTRALHRDFVDQVLCVLPVGDPTDVAVPSQASQQVCARQSQSDVRSILRIISKDVPRTRPELGFFSQDMCPGLQKHHRPEVGENLQVADPCTHGDVLARILLVYAKMNPGVGYVQGMNEICGPIYYLFSRDPLCSIADVEADTFFCFSLVMAEIQDTFVEDKNETQGGMFGRMQHVDEVLQESDAKLWAHLHSQGISPMMYTARWMSSLLAQDLQIPDVLRVWDALVGELVGPHPLLHFVCAARVECIKKELMASSEMECFELLKRGGYPEDVPVEEMLRVAFSLRSAYTMSPLLEMENQAHSPKYRTRLGALRSRNSASCPRGARLGSPPGSPRMHIAKTFPGEAR